MNHAPLLKKLLITCLLMFAFAFALVPLYDVFCDVTGLNGKPSLEQASASETINTQRQVDVSFTTHAQSGAPFKVQSEQYSVSVQPGAMREVKFSAKNTSNEDKVMQAIPSVSPGKAAKYLHKIACFCFDQQPLKAGEEVEFTLLFYVDTELPDDVEELTLSYTMFDISGQIVAKND
ncbi:cytochrome c oxidase assembly protein [Pseudoalteromonas sp. Hal040]|jgi:cytochrome c oxidase assembly protein subunit 11|uniref:Cytochrome c oxidase assembly protein CtaG n=1 Tax=Pseudoalteromonas gelatinilytica TaxID=1703256 RepID=A0A3A3EPR2_9GAMM|nr:MULTISPECIES: cytochrome c oxidase assembly protein [Pseudoalteromonas]MBN4057667.1 cytochrome c oxidase assembly protein [Pseudoalteromonas haloplanktis]RJF38155.1 cytochrome c oxidase assembly protein [Pseudoalteromonas profundi]TMO30359.1 cytochrome c oxidase assembly protein [Pseudoalteromonas sp. S4492]GGF13525.1 cytochrome c oxidase assembly protein [Pseudoalteromonas profundi]